MAVVSSVFYHSIKREYTRSFDVAEFGTLNSNTRLSFLGRIDNLLANVFTLSITIGPDD